MNILITGSQGILGRHVCDTLSKMDEKITVLKFNGDITDVSNVEQNFQNLKQLDAVIHLAAIVSLTDVEANPARAYAVNVGGTINVLNAMQRYENKPYFMFASTAHIYAQSNTPINENAVKKPLSLYGKTKFIAEQVAEDICRLNQQKYCALRIFSLFDENQKPPFLYGAIRKRLEEENLDEPFFVFQADSLRDFSSAKKLADLMVQLLYRKATGPINIGSGKSTKIRDFVQSLSPKKLEIVSDNTKTALVADISKMNRVLS